MSAAGLPLPASAAAGAARGTGPALAALVLLGGALRLVGLGAEPLWLDEAFTWRWAHLPWAELFGPAARTETNPPPWFAVERLVLLLLGDGAAALRLPAALLGIAAVPLGYLLGRRLAGERGGLLAALLLAVDPLLVAYAQEARGYALLVAGTLLALWGVLAWFGSPGGDPSAAPAARPGGRSVPLLPLAAYAAGASAVLWAHNTGPLLLLLANLAALVLWIGGQGAGRRPVLPWLAANLVAVLPWLLWLPILLGQAGDAVNVAWIRQPSPQGALAATLRLFGPHHLPLDPIATALAGLPALGLAGWAAVRLGPGARTAVLLAAGLPLLCYLVGLLLRPVWIERALLPALAVGLVLAGAGLARLLPGRLGVALLVVLLLPRAADLAAWHRGPQKLPWPAAVAEVGAGLEAGDAVLVTPHFYHWPWAYHAGRAGLRPAVLGLVVGPPPPPGAPRIEPVDRGLELVEPAGLEAALAGRTRAWLLAYKRRGGDPGGVLARLAAMGSLAPRGRWTGTWDGGELELWLWTRGAAGGAARMDGRPPPA